MYFILLCILFIKCMLIVYRIAPDLKSVVYCTAMRKGGQAEYDFLFARYENATQMVSEQSLILTALGCASDVNLLNA